MIERVPPQVTDVEGSLLGACLVEPTAATAAFSIVAPRHFYDPRHRAVAKAILDVREDGQRADLVSVSARLKADGANVQGSYLSHLTTLHPTTDRGSIENYARIIFDKSMLRETITAAQGTLAAAYDPAADPFDVIEALQRETSKILQSIPGREGTMLSAAISEAIERAREAEAARAKGQTVTGVPTGFHELDRMTSGWQRGEMIVLAARPSMGKSALALGTAVAAARAGTGCLFFTLEMQPHLFGQRTLAADADVDAFNIRSGRLMGDDWERIDQSARGLDGLPLELVYEPGLSPERFQAQVARAKAKHGDGLGLVVVDYLQLMGAARSDAGRNREQEVATISRTMKHVAGQYDVAVLALSQLSRSCESRSDKRPMLSDLRESGAIEQDADAALFIYRAERYGITHDTIYEGGQQVEVNTTGLAEVIVGKQRSGPVGTAYLGFDASRTRFYDRGAPLPGPGGDGNASIHAPIPGGF